MFDRDHLDVSLIKVLGGCAGGAVIKRVYRKAEIGRQHACLNVALLRREERLVVVLMDRMRARPFGQDAGHPRARGGHDNVSSAWPPQATLHSSSIASISRHDRLPGLYSNRSTNIFEFALCTEHVSTAAFVKQNVVSEGRQTGGFVRS